MKIVAVSVAVLLLAVPCIQAQVSGDLRLVSSTSTSSSGGRLEIYLRGQWGTVCDDGFGFTEADVACKQLGYANGASNVGSVIALAYPRASPGTPIWLDNVDCSSTSQTLLSCTNSGIGIHLCIRSEDVAIECTLNGPNVGAIVGYVLIFIGAVLAFCAIILAIIAIFYRKKRKAVALRTATATTQLNTPLVVNTTPTNDDSKAPYAPYPPQPPQESGYTSVPVNPVQGDGAPYPDPDGASNTAYIPPLPK